MEIFVTKKDFVDYLDQFRNHKAVIGFVPTMGALHAGHISLIKIARAQSNIVVCSIFVNPTQFSDLKDLEKYPRPIEEDIKKLKNAKCDVLFLPDVDEMYSDNEDWHIDIGELENMLEAIYRPGHYQGVTQIVKKLFDIVKPNLIFLGQKDFQQYLVIKKMVKILRLSVRLIMCPTIRDKDGLAMSSRNVHLSETQHQQALVLSQALNLIKENFKEKTIQQLKADGTALLNKSEGAELEYFEICNAKDLRPAVTKKNKSLIALVAAKIGSTRLIDNMILK